MKSFQSRHVMTRNWCHVRKARDNKVSKNYSVMQAVNGKIVAPFLEKM